MKDDVKTESVIFRLSPKQKKWLELLVEASQEKTVTKYLNDLIADSMRDLMYKKAMENGMFKVAQKFNIPKSLHEGFDGSFTAKNESRFLRLIRFLGNDKAKKFLSDWLTESEIAFDTIQEQHDCKSYNKVDPSPIIDWSIRMSYLLNTDFRERYQVVREDN